MKLKPYLLSLQIYVEARKVEASVRVCVCVCVCVLKLSGGCMDIYFIIF